MIPYQTPNTTVVVASAADFMPIAFPGRGALTQLQAIKSTGWNVGVFSRAFSTADINIISVLSDGDTNTVLHLETALRVKVGDPLTVAATTVGGYNTTHRVTQISADRKTVHTDQTYSANATGGTATLAITGNEQELYRVLAAQTDSGGIVNYQNNDGIPYANQDPKDHDGSTVPRLLYLKFSATGTYNVTLAAKLPETHGL